MIRSRIGARLVLTLAVLTVSCGSGSLTTQEASTTSQAPSTTSPEEPVTADSTVTELDNGALSNLSTWPEYVDSVPVQRSLRCLAVAQRDTFFSRWLPDPDPEARIYDVTDGSAQQILSSEDVPETIQRAADRIIGIADDAAPEDWAPNDLDTSCPTGQSSAFGSGTIGIAFLNFSSDEERFGGRGQWAAGRCVASAALDLILRELDAGAPPVPLIWQLDASLELINAQWADRPPDQAYVDIASTLVAAGLTEDGQHPESLTEEQADAVSAALTALETYRESKPEGFVYCPLDQGWTPS